MKTASDATAVQIVYPSHRGSQDIEHIDSACDDPELELLKAVARQWLAGGRDELDLGLDSLGLDTCVAGGPRKFHRALPALLNPGIGGRRQIDLTTDSDGDSNGAARPPHGAHGTAHCGEVEAYDLGLSLN